MKEIEVKARMQNRKEVMAKLQALGCELSNPIIQSDSVFVPKNIDRLPADIGVPVLRIRESNQKYLLTLKTRLTNGLDKSESETEVTDPVATKEIIVGSGFKPMVSFTKKRIKCKYNNWEVCIDEVEGLGNFIEVEEMSENGNSEEIQAELFSFLKSLGIKDEDREHYGYDVLMYQKK